MTYGLQYGIMLSRGKGNGPKPKGGKCRKGGRMNEEMTNEQMYTMLRMILEIMEGCKDLEEAKEKVRALLIK